jgi:formamidopyrimidine-DNA glycosylase
MADGSRLVFHDPRRFGVMRVARLGELDELRELGLDPLEGGWNEAELRVLLRRRAPVKNVLLDQRVFAGIGNIYASEILFQARVRPQRRAAALRLREIRALAAAIRSVLAEAVRLGGSSISDFRDGAGRYGKFQHQLAVYDRAGDVCRECSNEIRRLVLAGRSSFYCPACQR